MKKEYKEKLEGIEKEFKEKVARYYVKKKQIEEEELADGLPEVRYAFIVFRDMQAVDYIIKAHDIGWLKRKFLMSSIGEKYFPWSHQQVKKLHFFK